MSLAILDQMVNTAIARLLPIQVNGFNAASNGAILLNSNATFGDFSSHTEWGNLGLPTRFNPRDSAAATILDLNQLVLDSLKIAGSYGPYRAPMALLQREAKALAEPAAVLAAQVTQGIMADQLGTALTALNAHITGNTALVTTIAEPSATTAVAGDIDVSLPVLQKGVKVFGDQQQTVVRCFAMNGTVWNYLIVNGLVQNQNQLFKFETLAGGLYSDGLGRTYLITDLCADNTILALTDGAAVVSQMVPIFVSAPDLTAKAAQNLIKAEWQYDLALKNCGIASAVKTAVKTGSATDAQIKAAATWVKQYTDNKQAPGAAIVFTPKK